MRHSYKFRNSQVVKRSSVDSIKEVDIVEDIRSFRFFQYRKMAHDDQGNNSQKAKSLFTRAFEFFEAIALCKGFTLGTNLGAESQYLLYAVEMTPEAKRAHFPNIPYHNIAIEARLYHPELMPTLQSYKTRSIRRLVKRTIFRENRAEWDLVVFRTGPLSPGAETAPQEAPLPATDNNTQNFTSTDAEDIPSRRKPKSNYKRESDRLRQYNRRSVGSNVFPRTSRFDSNTWNTFERLYSFEHGRLLPGASFQFSSDTEKQDYIQAQEKALVFLNRFSTKLYHEYDDEYHRLLKEQKVDEYSLKLR
ncbi:hypothetical protein GGR57DRAFT_514105 [Xylariaceae sp. FL1272]|nr:hypothetical protein GGR57DRAFT_514105 [Xylariaceae sp. FL1272]